MSKEFFKETLEKFQKSNKERRQKLAEKAGYKTADEFEAFLAEGAGEKVTKKQKPRKVRVVKVENVGDKVIVTKPTEKLELLDMVFAFDTTGSMRSYIANVKLHVSKIIPELLADNPNINIGIVAFGDYADLPYDLSNFGNAYQVIEPSRNSDALQLFIETAKNTTGGDYPEFYDLVLHKIITETPWREGAEKTIVLIADASLHTKGEVHQIPSETGIGIKKYVTKSEEEIINEAVNFGVKIDTLRVGNDGNSWYKRVSKGTQGVSADFKDSSNTTQIIKASALARGGEATKAVFLSTLASKEVTSNKDLTSVYTAYKTIID